ncbi:CALYX [Buzura suppressaria nucleopolyhedrovirus]|uniref:CALYX n=2 Tax=Buzura suppressaria nuclear polyhedrosis virus TaxID=74320 RepID=W5VSD0_NPVBS|nr:CALYX [Buzura suppressaria nucleopolyhedrovirus]AHH82687.1 CALYX [Buzura suppressaria nucleopolyhedrovirus]AKN91071.1 CALYX/PEP [Buzura suppressaria nucleopolyhedrovirus]QYF10644.1 calyx polyhedron envelope [Buzura suppressaria nucleopolyhedrovirus]
MSFTVLTKKIQELPVTAFLDQTCVLWVSADDVLCVLRLPLSVLQSIPLRHKKCWNDFRWNSTNVPNTCRLEASRLFVDIYGLGNLCNRVNSNQADYLCTLFIAEVYREACDGTNNNGGSGGCVPLPEPDCSRPPPPPHHHHDHHDTLDRIAKQNDLIISGLGQLCINNSNQHLEMTNILNSIKLQNVTIAGQLTQLIDQLDTQLGSISTDVKALLAQFDDKLETLLAAVNRALNQLQESVRNELTNINSILNNLTSSVTNINATLNNLLQAVNSLDLGNVSTQLETILTTVEQILAILTPEILGKLK